MLLLGYDIGSSSVKASLVDADTREVIGFQKSPINEMPIDAPKAGFAEQDPKLWWHHVKQTTKALFASSEHNPNDVKAIGIAYQMHGLVLLDKDHQLLRPSIIWCDSRAVDCGKYAVKQLGSSYCLEHYLNTPGNFTASKLRWVKQNEPDIYNQIEHCLLPGDYIAFRMTGHIATTTTGLSEGILWDFKEERRAMELMDAMDIDASLWPESVATFGEQGRLSGAASDELGLPPNIIVSYRAGDQPNNAMALNVFNPNEAAATGGTSGVIYTITDQLIHDTKSRINGFAHVNHSSDQKRIGQLLCINGAGIQYAWMKKQVAPSDVDYAMMEQDTQSIPIGSEGLRVMPFGNGAERIFENKIIGSHILHLDLNRHQKRHLYKASLEGIAFAFVYGFEILKSIGLNPNLLHVGNDNLFRSSHFSNCICNLLGIPIKLIDTTGAHGAALGAGFGAGIYNSLVEAFQNQKIEKIYHPGHDAQVYQDVYAAWCTDLNHILTNHLKS
ncbi:MAG: carbohydrate kinase [Saprospiraceae bacterium]|nr:carbohydrate kinase [Saprospiraceae bacterium]